MDAALTFDFSSSIRYALTPRPAPGGRFDIVLDLFRGAAPALTRTVASVGSHELAPVVLACRRYLERRGAHAVSQTETAPEPAPAWAAPVAAFDWMFAG
ncbi:hypothetical protein D3273_00730 [Lichenibacterium minor]|uniref:Uncharacterized protein n=1 Tax=Lichenibacterium minor TaxID=2316528 RepID=A0A4Q2UB45_9HYPH|nr:hypothetical protein [Lichenibacterium minor]RYC33812.1 hypothetical protein D3273_00730 [Lichenibacterium minor]